MKHVTLITILTACALLPSGSAPAAESSMKPDTVKAPASEEKATVPAKSAEARTAEKLIGEVPRDQQTQLLSLLNEGSSGELNSINGIAAVRAKAIMEARPFGSLSEIVEVKGIGNVTFTRILGHAKVLARKSEPMKTKS